VSQSEPLLWDDIDPVIVDDDGQRADAPLASAVTEAPDPVADPILNDEGQGQLFEMPRAWTEHWDGMPDFIQKDALPHDTITVQFKSDEDRRAFLTLLGERPDRRKSIWYPQVKYLTQSVQDAPSTIVPAGRYPIYVISKGRWDSRLTVKALEKLGLEFSLVVEPQEFEAYADVINPEKIHVLPFSNLGQGSIPARNWVWDHAAASGAARHWILDDNMDGFYELNHNLKRKVVDKNPFTLTEEFVDRYENVALAGLQYEFFAMRRAELPPFVLNTRIYSCILIKNDLPYRWRGRYNEDTDLSLRALKDGWVTALFNAFLCKKMPTMTMSGGNTDELYQEDGRLKMAESLRDQHPDVVTITRKWDRWQHQVNYEPFKRNALVLRTP